MAVGAAVAVAVGLLTVASPGSAATARDRAVGSSGTATTDTALTVTLLTGDQVRVRTAGGRTPATVRSAASGGPARS